MPVYNITPNIKGDGFLIKSPDGEGCYGQYVLDGANRVYIEAPNIMPPGNVLSAAHNQDGSFAGWVAVGGVSVHSELTGNDEGDDHPMYAFLAGRAGGQVYIGGTGAGDDLVLQSTSHVTKDRIFFGSLSAYDELNKRLGIGTPTPTQAVEIGSSVASGFTGSANLVFTYTGGAGYRNSIFNRFSGTPELHVMEFRVMQNSTEIVPLTFSASGLTTFAGNVGINTGGTAPVGTLETGNVNQTDAVHLVMGYTLSPNYKHKVKSSFSGLADAGNRMKFFVVNALANADINVLNLTGEANVGVGTEVFGTNAIRVFAIGNGTAPSTSPVDASQLWSSDQTAGNACLHTRTENGAVIKFYRETGVADADGSLPDITAKFNLLLSRLEAQGHFAAA